MPGELGKPLRGASPLARRVGQGEGCDEGLLARRVGQGQGCDEGLPAREYSVDNCWL